MCGIVGAWSLDGPLDPDVLPRSSLDSIRHRGPDGDGWYADDRCRLGFRRLAIIDVAGGQQPMRNEQGSLLMTLNGEIYNHHELRRQLALDHDFQSKSDVEVALHGFETWGTDVFRRMRGMFAVALADRRRQRLVLARDRVGKKPLYYTIRNDTLLWASELAPLLIDGRPPIDRAALNDYLRFGYVPAPRTLLEGIHKLPAGCMLVAGPEGQVQLHRWSPLLAADPATDDLDVEGWSGAVREALADAVAARMESEVPLGFLLSGGIDSASVFALGAGVGPAARAFTVGFSEADVDETAAAAEVAARYRAHHSVRRLDRHEAPDLGAVVARCEEPVATDALLPTDRIFAAVRAAGITTILAGEGADEIFAGYSKFAVAAGWSPGGAEAWQRAGATPVDRYLSTEEFCFPTLAERRALIGEVANDEGFGWLDDAVDDLDPLSQMLAIEVALRLPDRINLRLDRLSMAYGIEARAPFMDRPLMELALAVPHALRTRPDQVKWILREALRDDLPSRVVDAPKAPFRAPDRWFADDDALDPAAVLDAGLVSAPAVAALRARAETDAGARERLYNLTVLHLWHRDWYRAGAPPAA